MFMIVQSLEGSTNRMVLLSKKYFAGFLCEKQVWEQYYPESIVFLIFILQTGNKNTTRYTGGQKP